MIISIDVGIKNLSYCIFVDASQTIHIHDWGVLDLCRDEKVEVCQHKTKKGVCGRNASHTIGGTSYCCGTHIKKCNIRTAPEEYYKAKKQKKISKTMIDTLCKIYDYKCGETILQHIFENSSTKLNKTPSASGMDLIDIGRAISIKLNQVISNIQITKVLIENQIGPIANRMKCIQGMISQFFIERSVYDITFVSSLNKLRNYDVPKKTYKERKQSGIEVTRKLLTDNSHLSEWNICFNNHKKKDDLADSFLQGLWFIKCIALSYT